MQKSLFGKYLRVTMVIVLASFIVLGSVMMLAFSQYTKNDKRKLLMQNASSMASITSAVDITNNGAPDLLKLFVRTFSLNIDADIFVTDLEGNVLFGAYANSTSNIGANFIPKNCDASVVDEVLTVTDEEAYKMAKLLARTEGILVGITSGAALAAAVRLLRMPENAEKTLVALLPDSGDRYFSTPIFE